MEVVHPHEEKQTECAKEGEERQGQGAMLWSIREAVARQTMQICLWGNGHSTTHAQLIAGAEQASGGHVLGCHFPLLTPAGEAGTLAGTVDPERGSARGNHEHAAGMAPPTHLWDRTQRCLYDQPRGCGASFPALVVKASGLAAGKGVIVAKDQEACQAVLDIMKDKMFGYAGETVVVEELLDIEEVSCLCFSDGCTVSPMPPAQDHKSLQDGDLGPNTGGMGAYCPTPQVSQELLQQIRETFLQKTVDGMKEEGATYVGVLYAGLMLTKQGPKVLEFNCRFGDPECQVLMPLLKSDLYEVLQSTLQGKMASSAPVWHQDGSAVTVVMASPGYPGSYKKGVAITGGEGLVRGGDGAHLQLALGLTERLKGIAAATSPCKRARVGVLISGTGTNLQALMEQAKSTSSSAEIVVVISNRPEVLGLKRASLVVIQTRVIDHKLYGSQAEFDGTIDRMLEEFDVEVVCLAGFMRILTGSFVRKWNGKLLNIHPSLLPKKQALQAGARVTGCTVHFVAEEVDAGDIIAQEAVPVLMNDTEESLSDRIREAEHRAFSAALELVAAGGVSLGDDGCIVWNPNAQC
ncbi:trifunctional purine biosynthetic protein adenosine-3-like [Oncorhynchus keta]|uniref:trifunctional purine biosynthetic protein adenosine-3-like n=1 Tax=Oncorhynchus keta TaxID=8018 RepID=UPI00227B3CED|nr:trifunctional purine biosynthetic protein adenosine-3-like [Oncorhynchus keta]